jgi:hypothetical protein
LGRITSGDIDDVGRWGAVEDDDVVVVLLLLLLLEVVELKIGIDALLSSS